MTKTSPLLFLIVFILSCNQKANKEGQDYVFSRGEEEIMDPNEPFFPFVDYVQQQIAHVDTTPFAIEKIVHVNGQKVDSSFISKDIYKAWASKFTDMDPNNPYIKPKFKETSILDLTLNRITFSIVSIEKDFPLQQADIYVNPDNDKVKTVLLRKLFDFQDSTVFQHLVWIDNRYFQISETINLKDNKEYTRVTKIIWDRDPE